MRILSTRQSEPVKKNQWWIKRENSQGKIKGWWLLHREPRCLTQCPAVLWWGGISLQAYHLHHREISHSSILWMTPDSPESLTWGTCTVVTLQPHSPRPYWTCRTPPHSQLRTPWSPPRCQAPRVTWGSCDSYIEVYAKLYIKVRGWSYYNYYW